MLPLLPLLLMDTIATPGPARVDVWGDLDGDGQDDLLWMDSGDRRITVAPRARPDRPHIVHRSAEELNLVESGDLDGDGDLEAWWTGRQSARLFVLHDDPFRVQAIPVEYSISVATYASDLDGDGTKEIIVASEGFPTKVFAVTPTEPPVVQVLAGIGGEIHPRPPRDLDGDGKPEISFTDNGYRTDIVRLFVYSGTERRALMDPWPSMKQWWPADFDGNGQARLFADGGTGGLRVFTLGTDGLTEDPSIPQAPCPLDHIAEIGERDTLLCAEVDGSVQRIIAWGLKEDRWERIWASPDLDVAHGPIAMRRTFSQGGQTYGLIHPRHVDTKRPRRTHRVRIEPSQSTVTAP